MIISVFEILGNEIRIQMYLYHFFLHGILVGTNTSRKYFCYDAECKKCFKVVDSLKLSVSKLPTHSGF